jgi:hypothetical protein
MNSAFDELAYLKMNPDVAEAVEHGAFGSGLEHYLKHGRQEGRAANYPELMEQLISASIVLKRTLSTRDAQIVELKQQLTDQNRVLQAIIQEIRHSTSWRVTAPLRWPKMQFLAVQRIIQLGIYALQLGGGLKPTMRKAANLYHREGISGVRRGLHRGCRY